MFSCAWLIENEPPQKSSTSSAGGDVPEVPKSAIDALEASIHSAETWVIIFGVVVAIGIVGEVGFGLRTFFLNKKFRIEQRAEEQRSREEIARLTAETAKARKDAAEAEAHSAEANKTAAEANEKAAKANEAAERERLARVKIEQAMAHRRLLPAAQAALAAKLRKFAGQKIAVEPLSQDIEVQRITEELVVALTGPGGAGWIVASRSGLQIGGTAVSGIAVSTIKITVGTRPGM